MNNMRLLIGAAVAALLLVGGVFAYSVLRAPEAASGPIEAIPLDASSPVAVATAEASSPPASEAAASTAAEASVAASTASEPATANGAGSGTDGAIVAEIVPEESEVRFVIDEVLNNAPKTVIGTTSQVAGELAVDPDDPSQTRLGIIQVNARDLTTDNDFRNRALKNRILLTDQYEYVTFEPTEIAGLPEDGAVGQSYTFTISGNLTIKDVTQPVTFEVTATPESDSRLAGTAQTTIRYADFGITIPSVPQVASVEDEVRLEIDFVAVAK